MIIKLYKLFHFSHLIFLDPVYSEHILQYSQPIIFLWEEFDERSLGLKNYGTRISVVCFTFTGRLWHTCRISVNGINLKCNTKLETEVLWNRSFMKQNCKTFMPSCHKKNFLCSGPFGSELLQCSVTFTCVNTFSPYDQ